MRTRQAGCAPRLCRRWYDEPFRELWLTTPDPLTTVNA